MRIIVEVVFPVIADLEIEDDIVHDIDKLLSLIGDETAGIMDQTEIIPEVSEVIRPTIGFPKIQGLACKRIQ